MKRKKTNAKKITRNTPVLKKKRSYTKLFIFGVILAISLSIIGIGLWSTTQATLKDSDSKTNNFSYGDLRAELIEEFIPNQHIQVGSVYEKKVSVKNTGEVDTFIRVLVLPEILSKVAAGDTPVLLPSMVGKELELLDQLGLPVTNSANWQNGQDGYYYYLKKLKPGETTVTLFESAKVAPNLITTDSLYESATLDIHVKVEGIHTTQFAYRDGWWQGKVPVNPDLVIVDEALKLLTH